MTIKIIPKKEPRYGIEKIIVRWGKWYFSLITFRIFRYYIYLYKHREKERPTNWTVVLACWSRSRLISHSLRLQKFHGEPRRHVWDLIETPGIDRETENCPFPTLYIYSIWVVTAKACSLAHLCCGLIPFLLSSLSFSKERLTSARNVGWPPLVDSITWPPPSPYLVFSKVSFVFSLFLFISLYRGLLVLLFLLPTAYCLLLLLLLLPFIPWTRLAIIKSIYSRSYSFVNPLRFALPIWEG